MDGVDPEEAARRYGLAIDQHIRRSAGQMKRRKRADDGRNAARDLVLKLARNRGLFACPDDLVAISTRAGWGGQPGHDTTGRAYREFVLQLERDGLLVEKRGEDDKLIGYTLTDSGLAYLEQE